jgi:curved DNA-binding protein CbpA
MADPHEILGVSRSSSEADIRRRYLELVRRYPPDRDPERFKEIHQAYEKLRDPLLRMESRLFDLESGETMAGVITDVRQRLRKSRISTPTLLSLAERP